MAEPFYVFWFALGEGGSESGGEMALTFDSVYRGVECGLPTMSHRCTPD